MNINWFFFLLSLLFIGKFDKNIDFKQYLTIFGQKNDSGSEFGHSIVIIDINADDYEDLIVSSPRSGRLSLKYFVKILDNIYPFLTS